MSIQFFLLFFFSSRWLQAEPIVTNCWNKLANRLQ